MRESVSLRKIGKTLTFSTITLQLAKGAAKEQTRPQPFYDAHQIPYSTYARENVLSRPYAT